MIIYIEQVLIDNFIINLYIILSLKAIFKANFKKLNIILSSLMGSFLALFLPLFNIDYIFNIIIKILLSLTMVIILKKYSKFKEYMLYYLSFLLLTFVFGGACLFLLITFDNNFSASNYYSYSLPLGVIVIIIFFVFLVIKNIFKNIYSRKKINNFIYQIEIENNSETDKLTAFLDSGNTLVDILTNKPITIVDFYSLKNVLKNISITDIVLNKETKLNKAFKTVRIIETKSIGNSVNKILVIEVEKMKIYSENTTNIISNAMIGLTLKPFINDLGYSALLNSKLF